MDLALLVKGLFGVAIISGLIAAWRFLQSIRAEQVNIIKERVDLGLKENDQNINSLDIDTLIQQDNERLSKLRSSNKDPKE